MKDILTISTIQSKAELIANTNEMFKSINTIIYFIGNPSVKLPIIGVVGLYNIFVGCIAALLFGGYIVIMFLKAAELSRIDEKKKP